MILEKQAIKDRSPLHFARYEFKYILSAGQFELIERELQHFLQYDPFVQEQPNHSYQVRSLYFDDSVNSAFYDKVDGLHSRYKFRLRTYSLTETEKAPLFLEIKGRHNNLVYKHRTPVNYGDFSWSGLAKTDLIEAIFLEAQDSSVLQQFKFDLIRKRLQAIALIDYERHPYISKYDSSFRLTFDVNLRVTQTDCIFPTAKAVCKKILPGYIILEAKFRHHMPAWFHAVIQAYELQRVSVSKICAGMKSLGLANDY